MSAGLGVDWLMGMQMTSVPSQQPVSSSRLCAPVGGRGLSRKGGTNGEAGWEDREFQVPNSGDLGSGPEAEELFGQVLNRRACISSPVTWGCPLCLFSSWSGCEDQVS